MYISKVQGTKDKVQQPDSVTFRLIKDSVLKHA